MRIVYKGTRSGKTRVAIITYGDNEEDKAYEIAIKIRNITSYKVDTCVSDLTRNNIATNILIEV